MSANCPPRSGYWKRTSLAIRSPCCKEHTGYRLLYPFIRGWHHKKSNGCPNGTKLGTRCPHCLLCHLYIIGSSPGNVKSHHIYIKELHVCIKVTSDCMCTFCQTINRQHLKMMGFADLKINSFLYWNMMVLYKCNHPIFCNIVWFPDRQLDRCTMIY